MHHVYYFKIYLLVMTWSLLSRGMSYADVLTQSHGADVRKNLTIKVLTPG